MNIDLPAAGDLNAGDFDADGNTDLVVGIGTDVVVLYGNGDGSFEPPAPLGIGEAAPRTEADVDGDGRVDFLMIRGSPRVLVLRNLGARAYAPAVEYPVGTTPTGIAAADFTGDGRTDLAVCNHLSHNMCVLLNRGDGTFGDAAFYGGGGSHPGRIAAADFNRDGRLDLAMSNVVSNNLVTWFGDGRGAFTGGPGYRVDEYADQLFASDFSGDGLIDLVVGNYLSNSVSLLTGDGSGNFAPHRSFGAHQYPLIMSSADLDLDGDLDLAAPNAGTGFFSVLENTGGAFAAPVAFNADGFDVKTSAIGDFDGDGRWDVAVGASTTRRVCVFLNRTPLPLTPPDRLEVVAASPYRVEVSWRDNSETEGSFELERRTGTGAFLALAVLPPDTTTYSDGGRLPNRSYTYRVRAAGATGYSRWSDLATGTTLSGLSFLEVYPPSVRGGRPATGRIVLTGPSPEGGAVVTLSSSIPSAATAPQSVEVPAGVSAATFTILTRRPRRSTTVILTARYWDVARNDSLVVRRRS